MKPIIFALGIVCLVLAAIYFVMPADSLPNWLPGHEAGMPRLRIKHGVAAAAAGAILFVVGWFAGRGR